MNFGLLRSFLFVLLVGLLSLVVVSGLLPGIRQVADLNDRWVSEARRTSQHAGSQLLFDSAVYHDVIVYDPEVDRIVVRSRRYLEHQARTTGAENRKTRVLPGERRSDRDVELLDRETTVEMVWKSTGAGFELREAVDAAMRGRAVIGIRDHGLTPGCPAFSDKDCEGGHWALTPVTEMTEDTALLAGAGGHGRPDPGFFTSLSDDERNFFGVWRFESSALATQPTHIAAPRVTTNSDGRTVIDVIGRIDNTHSLPIDGTLQRSYFCAETRGVGFDRIGPCDKPAEAIVTRLEFDRSQWQAQGRIHLQPVKLPILKAGWQQDLHSGGDQSDDLHLRLSDRIGLHCGAVTCTPTLRTSERMRRATRDLAAISEQGTQLTKVNENSPDAGNAATGIGGEPAFVRVPLSEYIDVIAPGEYGPSTRASALELVPAIGLPAASRGSFIELLQNLPPGVQAQDLTLTFDANVQQVVLDVFRSYLVDRNFPHQPDSLISVDDGLRRAAFVVVDLRGGPDAGAIRAAVGYPFFDGRRSRWSLEAQSYRAAANFSLTPFVWRGLDSRFSPGSSMKVVSALSLVRTATGQTKNVSQQMRASIGDAIGGLAPEPFERRFGWSLNTRGRPILRDRRDATSQFTLRDRGSRVFPAARGSHLACGHRYPEGGSPNAYGLCEALARSSNIWFASMALSENQLILDGLYDAAVPQRDFTGLGQTFRALGQNAALPLVRFPAGTDPRESFGPRMEAPVIGSAPDLAGNHLGEPIWEPHREVAQNAYGQGSAQVTPLGMASIAGSIALGTRVTPYLAATSNFAPPVAPPLVPDSVVGAALLDALRQGMKAVMQPGGTGRSRFAALPEAADILPRIHAKTGTAELDTRLSNLVYSGTRKAYSHWLVGWLNGRDGQPAYAFACAVSHVHDKTSPCLPLSAAALSAIDRLPER